MASPLSDVLDTLARAVVADADEVHIGEITLRPHQVTALAAVRRSLARNGGAILIDPPGSGKTFVALAAAASYEDVAVAAPASLRATWHDAATRAGVPIRFVSLEALSTGRRIAAAPLVIVDEAHRAANPANARHRAIADLTAGAHVLLLTGTPVRNRLGELGTLVAYFAGARAPRLLADPARECIVHTGGLGAGAVPVASRVLDRPPEIPGIASALRRLPPPLALADGRVARTLVVGGLAKGWESSAAALAAMITRRIQRGLAMRDVATSGQRLSRRELRAWVIGEDATQLPLPLDATELSGDAPALLDAIDAHLAALRDLARVLAPRVDADAGWRAEQLLRIAAGAAPHPIVAFTTFDATARAVFAALRGVPGVVLLSGRGAATAAGPVPRDDVLHALAADGAPSARFDPRVVVATDVLSEGVNLQRAAAIAHLDLPWTPAAVAQRVGRAARIGTRHDRIAEVWFPPPRGVESLLRLARIHERKRRAAGHAFSIPRGARELQATVAPWRLARRPAHRAVVAATIGAERGAIARVDSASGASLVAISWRCRRPSISDDPATVARIAAGVRPEEPRPMAREWADDAARLIRRWLSRRTAVRGAEGSTSTPVEVRRVLARLDGIVRTASPARLPDVAARAGRLRARIAALRGAGAALRLRAALDQTGSHDEWLEALESRLVGLASWDDYGAAELTALLLVQPPSAL